MSERENRRDEEPVEEIVRECLDDMPPEARARMESFLEDLSSTETASAETPSFPIIERYRLERVLGRGGFSVVYLARDERVDRRVALKVLEPSTDSKVNRFDEAQKLARVEHENIVRIHTVGEFGGRAYLEMEWIDGSTVEDIIEERGGSLPIREALAIARDVVRALTVVHRAGLVHRDVKPSNVMVTRAGITKLMDLGIAQDASDEEPAAGSDFGTPAYMAPEQYRGREVDPRADLFSLGALLYEMLSGRRPFPAADPEQVRRQVLQDRPVPLLEHCDIPAAVIDLIERLLRKDPAERFQTAAEVDQALSRLDVAPPDRRPTARRALFIGVTLALIAAAWLAISFFSGPSDRPSESMSAHPFQTDLRLTVGTSDGRWVPVRSDEPLRTGDQLRLHWRANLPSHVYVWTLTESGDYFALFPDPRSQRINPLPAGQAVTLPGYLPEAREEGTWDLGPPSGPQKIFLEATTESRPDLEAALAAMNETELTTGAQHRQSEAARFLQAHTRMASGQLRGVTKLGTAPASKQVQPAPVPTKTGVVWAIEFVQID